jgi:hypothetical protein
MKHQLSKLLPLLLLAACTADTADNGGGGGGSEVDSNGRVITTTLFNDAVDASSEIVNELDVSRILADEANIGSIAPGNIGNRDLAERIVGKEFDLSFDIDGNGQLESIYVFLERGDNITFMAWNDGSICHLAWQERSVAWYLFTPCGGGAPDGAIVCGAAASAEATCDQCLESGACESCRVSDSSNVYCEEEDEGEPDMGGFDTGRVEDVSEDAGEAVCSSACMSASGAECCLGCSCLGEVVCRPECGSGFEWDCEIQCCFSSETFECSD